MDSIATKNNLAREPSLEVVRRPFILHAFPTFDMGGAQTRFVKLANHFGPQLRHGVVAMDGRYGAIAHVDPDITLRRLEIPVRKNTLTGNLKILRNLLKTEKPDLLVTHNWGTIEWAMAKQGTAVRHIHMEDGFGQDEANGQYFRRKIARSILLRNSMLVVPSLTLAHIARKSWRLRNVHYIPNGIDCTRFSSAPVNTAEHMPVIGTVAALRPEKNIARLLRAFAAARAVIPSQLVIVGDGPERANLESQARALDIAEHVTFSGHVADTANLYGSFDIVALSSDTEQMPYTVLEAMAAGRPLVATNVGDVAYMLAAENRQYVVDRNDKALSDALIGLLRSAGERLTIGTANLARVRQHFSQEAMFRAFAKIYNFPEFNQT